MIKGPKIIDLIRGEYHGRWPQEYKSTPNGKKPIIRKSGKVLGGMDVFDHGLNPDRNVREVTSFNGKTFYVLLPTNDIHNFNQEMFNNTPWAQLAGDSSEKLAEKNRKIEELKDEIKKLEEELEEHEERGVEQDKYSGRSSGSGSVQGDLECSSCARIHDSAMWENNGGYCPHCNQTHMNEARQV